MSIESLGAVYGPPGVIPRTPGLEGSGEAGERKPTEALAPTGAEQGSRAPEPRATGELPPEAPPGTDPELWSVLTADEKRYFARAQTLGPVTYSPGTLGLAEIGLQRGGRLDVKV